MAVVCDVATATAAIVDHLYLLTKGTVGEATVFDDSAQLLVEDGPSTPELHMIEIVPIRPDKLAKPIILPIWLHPRALLNIDGIGSYISSRLEISRAVNIILKETEGGRTI